MVNETWVRIVRILRIRKNSNFYAQEKHPFLSSFSVFAHVFFSKKIRQKVCRFSSKDLKSFDPREVGVMNDLPAHPVTVANKGL